MDFNIDKYRVMNVGRKNPHKRYNISKVKLNRLECERDLGVQISLNLHPIKICIETRNWANRGFARDVTALRSTW